jgi:hypothetical protein
MAFNHSQQTASAVTPLAADGSSKFASRGINVVLIAVAAQRDPKAGVGEETGRQRQPRFRTPSR